MREFRPGLELCGSELPEADDALEVRSARGGSEVRKGLEDLVRLLFDLCRCSPSEDVWMGKIPTSPEAIIMPFHTLDGLLDPSDDPADFRRLIRSIRRPRNSSAPKKGIKQRRWRPLLLWTLMSLTCCAAGYWRLR